MPAAEAERLVKDAVADHFRDPTVIDCLHAAVDCEIVEDGRLLFVVHHTMSHTSVFEIDPKTVGSGKVGYKPLARKEIATAHDQSH